MKNAYLIAYNLIQFSGWLVVLFTNRMDFLTWFQTLQLIEVLHCMVGLVKSSAFQTFAQILSRLIIVWCALIPFKETHQTVGLDMILWAWPIAETTRYLYYALNLMKLNFYVVTWARYTFFIGLYPLGVSGELLILYKLMQIVKNNSAYSYSLPNPLNISLHSDIVLIIIVLSYVPFFPKLYLYMLSQRKKFLGPAQSKKDESVTSSTRSQVTRAQRQKAD